MPRSCRLVYRRGFTLVEMIVAVVLLGLIALIATSGARAIRSGGDERAALGVLEAELALAQAEATRYPNAQVLLAGQAERLTIVRNGVEIPQYARTLPSGYSVSEFQALVQADGTLLAPFSLTLTGPEATYSVNVDRGGMVR